MTSSGHLAQAVSSGRDERAHRESQSFYELAGRDNSQAETFIGIVVSSIECDEILAVVQHCRGKDGNVFGMRLISEAINVVYRQVGENFERVVNQSAERMNRFRQFISDVTFGFFADLNRSHTLQN